ncbi:MAG TPA: DUF488 family protein, partial [Polyangiaceae bacterium]
MLPAADSRDRGAFRVSTMFARAWAMARRSSWKRRLVYTIGHSTRSFEELVAMLRAFSVDMLVDIRTVPRSRHNPQFNADTLRARLRARRIRYVPL